MGGSGIRDQTEETSKGQPTITSNNSTLVSVITVVYNGGSLLEETINSVLAQTHPNIEYLIIDGKSSDKTLDIIRRYESHLAFWISEPDKGIYDAMNKGIKHARGEWIIFMNAGDRFYSPTSVADAYVRHIDADTSAVYGGVEVRFDNFQAGLKKIVVPKSTTNIWKGMICSHQSLFVRSSILKSRPFDLSAGTAADYDLIADLVERHLRLEQVDVVISSVSAGGVSDVRRMRSLQSGWCIARRRFAGPRTTIYYMFRGFGLVVRGVVKALLPRAAVLHILRRMLRKDSRE